MYSPVTLRSSWSCFKFVGNRDQGLKLIPVLIFWVKVEDCDMTSFSVSCWTSFFPPKCWNPPNSGEISFSKCRRSSDLIYKIPDWRSFGSCRGTRPARSRNSSLLSVPGQNSPWSPESAHLLCRTLGPVACADEAWTAKSRSKSRCIYYGAFSVGPPFSSNNDMSVFWLGISVFETDAFTIFSREGLENSY